MAAFDKLPIDPATQTLIQLLIVAELKVRMAIQQALTSGSLGTARYRRRRLAVIQRELDGVISQVQRQGPELLENAFTFGVKIAGGAELAGAFGTAGSKAAVDELVQNMLSEIEGGVRTLGRNANDVFRRVALRQTALHLLQTTTVKEAAKELQADLEKQAITSFVDRAGRNWGLANYSKMVIRTTTREAVTLGTTKGLQVSGRDLVKFSEHANACDQCKPYANQTFSLTGRVPGYPKLDHTPPIHPNCRCVIAPSAANFEMLEAQYGLGPMAQPQTLEIPLPTAIPTAA